MQTDRAAGRKSVGFRSMLVIIASLSAATARATVERPNGILVFPLAAVGEPDMSIVNAVNEALVNAAAEVDLVPVWAGEWLHQKLKVVPEEALASCKDDLRCIAKLGKKADTRELLFGQVRPADRGVMLTFITIGSDEGAVLRTVRIDVASAEVASTVIGDAFYVLLGITTPGTIEVTAIDSSVQVEIDGNMLGLGPGWYEVQPGRHSVKAGGVATSVMVHPGKTTTVVQPASATVPSAPEAQPSAATTPPPSSSASWVTRRRAGAVLAAGAAVPLVVGVIYRSRMQNTQTLLDGSTSNPDTRYYQGRVDHYRAAANAAYMIAGSMLVVGLVVVVYDWRVAAVPTMGSKATDVQVVVGKAF